MKEDMGGCVHEFGGSSRAVGHTGERGDRWQRVVKK